MRTGTTWSSIHKVGLRPNRKVVDAPAGNQQSRIEGLKKREGETKHCQKWNPIQKIHNKAAEEQEGINPSSIQQSHTNPIHNRCAKQKTRFSNGSEHQRQVYNISAQPGIIPSQSCPQISSEDFRTSDPFINNNNLTISPLSHNRHLHQRCPQPLPLAKVKDLSGTKTASQNRSDHGGRRQARNHFAAEIAGFSASPAAKKSLAAIRNAA